MGSKGNIQPGGNRNDGQKNLQHEHRPTNIRSNPREEQYSEYHDKLTNDENFHAGKPDNPEEMDFRNKFDNLENGNNE